MIITYSVKYNSSIYVIAVVIIMLFVKLRRFRKNDINSNKNIKIVMISMAKAVVNSDSKNSDNSNKDSMKE